MNLRARAILPLLAVAVCAVAPAGAEIPDGVPVIRNGAEPRDGLRTLRLEELWRVGGDDDEIFFGLVTGVDVDAEGDILLLDAQLSTVHVYSPDGEHLRTLFREGEGPGEVLRPRGMVALDDGRIGVFQEFPGKLVTVDAAGDPAGTIIVGGDNPAEGGFFSLFGAFSAGDAVVLSGTNSRPGGPGVSRRTNFLARFDATGRETARYAQNDCIYDFNDFVFDEAVHIPGFVWNAAVAADGRVFVAPDHLAYEIRTYAADGTLERVVTRDYSVVDRSAESRQAVRGMIENALTGTGIPYRVEVLAEEPVLSYFLRPLRLRPDGGLWVLTGEGARSPAEGVLAVFDAFDPDGVFVEQVALACPGDGAMDLALAAGPGRIVVVRGYADALAAQFGRGSRIGGGEEEAPPMEVVCYRIVE